MKVTIDLDKVEELVVKADEIFLSPGGEKNLLKLLDIQEKIDGAIKIAKMSLAAKAEEISPDFKSIQGEQIKVYYRTYGSRYSLDPAMIDEIPKELYKLHTRYAVNSKAVEEFEKQHGALPVGIREPERNKSITFARKK